MRRGNAAEHKRTERVAQAAALLFDNGLDDIAKFLLVKEKAARAPTRRAKRKVSVRSSTGRAVKGGAFWIDSVDLSAAEVIEEP